MSAGETRRARRVLRARPDEVVEAVGVLLRGTFAGVGDEVVVCVDVCPPPAEEVARRWFWCRHCPTRKVDRGEGHRGGMRPLPHRARGRPSGADRPLGKRATRWPRTCARKPPGRAVGCPSGGGGGAVACRCARILDAAGWACCWYWSPGSRAPLFRIAAENVARMSKPAPSPCGWVRRVAGRRPSGMQLAEVAGGHARSGGAPHRDGRAGRGGRLPLCSG